MNDDFERAPTAELTDLLIFQEGTFCISPAFWRKERRTVVVFDPSSCVQINPKSLWALLTSTQIVVSLDIFIFFFVVVTAARLLAILNVPDRFRACWRLPPLSLVLSDFSVLLAPKEVLLHGNLVTRPVFINLIRKNYYPLLLM